jgi:hypothetical protein
MNVYWEIYTCEKHYRTWDIEECEVYVCRYRDCEMYLYISRREL